MNEGMKNQMEPYEEVQHLLSCQKCVSIACTCLNYSHLLIIMINSYVVNSTVFGLYQNIIAVIGFGTMLLTYEPPLAIATVVAVIAVPNLYHVCY